MRFSVGDEIVCINNSPAIDLSLVEYGLDEKCELKYGETYKVTGVETNDKSVLLYGYSTEYSISRFKTKEEFRQDKLQHILDELDKKLDREKKLLEITIKIKKNRWKKWFV